MGQPFNTYDLRAIPGVKGANSPSEKNVDMDHQSPPADRPIRCSLLTRLICGIPEFSVT